MPVRIVRLIPCPTWSTFLRSLARQQKPNGPPLLLWQRQCHDCGTTIAVSQEVMKEFEAEPAGRLVCEQCVGPDPEPSVTPAGASPTQ
jgi:hypothetical protein